MSDHFDALSFVGDTVSRVVVSEAVSADCGADTTLEETLGRVAELAKKTISGSDMVSLTLLVEGRPRTVASTDVTAAEIDDVQHRLGIGPCLDAMGCQHRQRVDATDNDQRWPPFAEAAAARGIVSSLSLPLVARHAAIGSLNCYSRRPAAFSAEQEHLASGFAAAAAIAVANGQAYWDARHLSERLSLAMQSRATIEQAKGIVIAGQHCDADQAFEMLVRASQRENRKLRDIADQIVKTHCWQAIETIRVHPPAWLTNLTNPDRRPATPSRSPGSAPNSQYARPTPRAVQVGLPARRTGPFGPLRSG